MKRLFAIFILAVSVGLIVAADKVHASNRFDVRVIVNEKTQTKDALITALRSEIRSNSSGGGSEIFLSILSLEQYRAEASEIKKSDLLVTIGTVPMLDVAADNDETPILGVLIPRVSFELIRSKTIQSNPGREARKISAIYLDQPFGRRLSLVKHLLPDAKVAGAVLGPSTASDEKALRDAAKRIGLKLNVELVQNETQLVPALERVLKNSQVLIAVLDPLVFNRSNAQAVLLTSYRYRVPIIGISPAYTNAGALAAVYSTPDQIGKQLAREIRKLSNTQQKDILKSKYPDIFSVAINKHIARSLGIEIIDEQVLEQRLK